MVLLLLYPARKYLKSMRNLFRVHHWFRLHMIFGVWGPVLILLHSNFSLGSTNSTIALFSMLLVATSGLFGRYIYVQLHQGLYGKQIAFADLNSDYQHSKAQFRQGAFFTSQTQQTLEKIEAELTAGLVPIYTCIRCTREIKRLKKQSLKLAAKDPATQHWFWGLNKLRKIARHAFYTRLFSLWHFLHLPIFLMMIVTATVHIFVVHMY